MRSQDPVRGSLPLILGHDGQNTSGPQQSGALPSLLAARLTAEDVSAAFTAARIHFEVEDGGQDATLHAHRYTIGGAQLDAYVYRDHPDLDLLKNGGSTPHLVQAGNLAAVIGTDDASTANRIRDALLSLQPPTPAICNDTGSCAAGVRVNGRFYAAIYPAGWNLTADDADAPVGRIQEASGVEIVPPYLLYTVRNTPPDILLMAHTPEGWAPSRPMGPTGDDRFLIYACPHLSKDKSAGCAAPRPGGAIDRDGLEVYLQDSRLAGLGISIPNNMPANTMIQALLPPGDSGQRLLVSTGGTVLAVNFWDSAYRALPLRARWMSTSPDGQLLLYRDPESVGIVRTSADRWGETVLKLPATKDSTLADPDRGWRSPVGERILLARLNTDAGPRHWLLDAVSGEVTPLQIHVEGDFLPEVSGWLDENHILLTARAEPAGPGRFRSRRHACLQLPFGLGRAGRRHWRLHTAFPRPRRNVPAGRIHRRGAGAGAEAVEPSRWNNHMGDVEA